MGIVEERNTTATARLLKPPMVILNNLCTLPLVYPTATLLRKSLREGKQSDSALEDAPATGAIDVPLSSSISIGGKQRIPRVAKRKARDG
eukprot:1102471-Amphidinium_carterae.2